MERMPKGEVIFARLYAEEDLKEFPITSGLMMLLIEEIERIQPIEEAAEAVDALLNEQGCVYDYETAAENLRTALGKKSRYAKEVQ